MKRLTKAQAQQHEDLTVKLRESREALNAAIGAFNSEVKTAHAALQPKVDVVNAAIREANEFVEEIRGEMQDHYDEKSDRWQESDAGSSYSDWISSWEFELDDLSLEEPTAFEEIIMTDADEFENLDQEVPS